MKEAKRAYAEGDEVISVRPVIAPPQDAWDVGVEIPAGTCGVVVYVREYAYAFPYRVAFELGGLEVSVMESDIAMATLLESDPSGIPDLPPAPDPLPVGKREYPPYRPTKARPHKDCGTYHKANGLVLCACMVTAFVLQPLMAAIIAVCLLASTIILYFTSRGPFDAARVSGGESAVVDAVWAKRAAVLDHVWGWCLTAVLATSIFLAITSGGSSSPDSGDALTITCTLAFLVWAVKEGAHEQAVIGIETDD